MAVCAAAAAAALETFHQKNTNNNLIVAQLEKSGDSQMIHHLTIKNIFTTCLNNNLGVVCSFLGLVLIVIQTVDSSYNPLTTRQGTFIKGCRV